MASPMMGNDDSSRVDDVQSVQNAAAATMAGLDQTSAGSPMVPKALFRSDPNSDAQKPSQRQSGTEGQAKHRAEEDGQAKHRRAEEDDDDQSSTSSSDDDSPGEDSTTDDNGKDGSSSGDDDDHYDDGLSEYERLRLRNIRRNEARLAQLGLITNATTNTAAAAGRRSSSSSTLTSLLTSHSNNSGQAQQQPRKKRTKQPVAPIPRRSLPRRRCAKLKKRRRSSLGDDSDEDADSDAGGYSSDESSQASPVKIQRTLCPQPHQQELLPSEGHLKHYLRTRRTRRGRPKREEYVYKCDEVCKGCGGEWIFDNAKENATEDDDGEEEEDLEEKTRLIRCKDCRGAFHLQCMMSCCKDGDDSDVVNKENVDGEEDDRKPSSLSDPDDTLELHTRDPKRCYECESKHKLENQSSSTGVLSLLEATIDECTLRVRVTPEPALEAILEGRIATCYVTLGGQSSSRDTDGDGDGRQPKRVTWGHPLEEEEQEEQETDATALKIQKLITKALAAPEYSRLQDHSCATVRKYLDTEESTSSVVRLGGIHMIVTSMQYHAERPIIQAEAMCTLAEIAWRCPHLGIETINQGCLELAMNAMERHAVHSKVQQMGCGYFRALSYDGECCMKMNKSKKVVDTVVQSITRNPKKLHVLMEGCMFLQNMMVVSPKTTAPAILRSKRSDSEHFDILPTLLTSIQRNSNNNVDFVFSVFGLLLNVALDVKGRRYLQGLNADILAMNVIRRHPESPELHEVAFDLLQNTVNVEESNQEQILNLAELILLSMDKYPEEEMLQTNGCQLLGAVSQTQAVQSLIRDSANILTLASVNFPGGCKDLVDAMLRD